MVWKPSNRHNWLGFLHNWLDFLRESRTQDELRFLCELVIVVLLFQNFLEILGKLISKVFENCEFVEARLSNWEPPLRSPAMMPFPKGVLMFFYGITGQFVRFFSRYTNWCNGDIDYYPFDTKTEPGIACFFRWGFPGPDCRMLFLFFMKDIQAVRIHFQRGSYADFILFLEVRGKGSIALLYTDDFEAIKERAYHLSHFLDIPIIKSWLR